MEEKGTIFISYRRQTDSYFGAWLAAKLKSLGYDVWIDVHELTSGDAFWPEIEGVIRSKAIKFIVIVTKGYLEAIQDPKSGIFKELSTADRIDIKKFKSPITIDGVLEDEFPVQLMGLNSIDFSGNWQIGLEKLIEDFEKQKIKKSELPENSLVFWRDAFKINKIVNSETERIYTNWFEFQLPEFIFLHKAAPVSKLDLADVVYPFVEYSDRHLCFFSADAYPDSIKVISTSSFKVEDVLNASIVTVDDFLSLNEPRKRIIELVNKVVGDFLYQAGLKKYEQSKGFVFYYTNNEENRKRISLKNLGKTNVAVTGKNGVHRWSFGISSFAVLHPFPSLRISSHIIFESSESVVLEQDEQRQLRRKFGFDWYNRDWLDTLLGMMLKICKQAEDYKIRIPISPKENLTINAVPLFVDTEFGFDEPKKEEREDA